MTDKKDLKELVEAERKERMDKAGAILKKANEEIEQLGCGLMVSVIITAEGNIPQIQIVSKE